MKLKIGDPAPEIKSVDQDNKHFELKNYLGKKVVLYFYPKDNTPGCTLQSCNLRDNHELLKKKGYEVIGVSIDSVKSHQKFIKKYNLPFILVADTEKKIVNDYGVFGEKKMFGKTFMGTNRVTFVINEKGIIENIIDDVNTTEHTKQIIKN